MTQEEKTQIEERIVDVLKTVYDPEIPVNIWDLGMIYKIDVKEDGLPSQSHLFHLGPKWLRFSLSCFRPFY